MSGAIPQRRTDWQQRLIAYCAECHRTPYQVGVHDCALFAAGAVAAMTGVDAAAAFRGRYRTIWGGMRILRAAGFVDHVAMTASVLTEVPVAFGCPGDIAAMNTPEGPALGVVQGERIYVLRPEGIGTVLLTQADRMFRVWVI